MELTMELWLQCVAEVQREQKRKKVREYSRQYYLAHQYEILYKRRKIASDPESREKRRLYLREWRLKRKLKENSHVEEKAKEEI